MSPGMPEKLLYRLDEAAEALSVSKTMLYKLIHSGEIPAIRTGSDLRVPVAGLRAWIARQPAVVGRPRPRKK